MHNNAYLSWAALIFAVAANIAANIWLKKAMVTVDTSLGKGLFLQVLGSASFWAGGFFACLLLISYLSAIRHLPVGTAYAFTTSLAMAGIIVAENRLFGTHIGTSKAAGMALVALGVWLMAREV